MKKDSRRKFLKIMGLGGLAATGIGASIFSLPKKILAAPLKRKALKRSSDVPEKGTGVPTGPLKNHRWMNWLNPSQSVEDGWEHWQGTIQNPLHAKEYHDKFYEIKEIRPKIHHFVFVIDVNKCVGCQACVVGCKSENSVPLGVTRRVVDVMEKGHMIPDENGIVVTEEGNYTPNVKRIFLPRMCNHCDHPPCVEVCPVKATYKLQTGQVLINYDVCIGCLTCVQACPYGMRFANPVQHTADKCTMCAGRAAVSHEKSYVPLLPVCVTTCVGRAISFGDSNDPQSEVSKLIATHKTSRLKISAGTDPQVYYIGLDGDLTYSTDPEEVKMVYTYAMSLNASAYSKLGGTPVLPFIEEREHPYAG
jgi:tetrathionate reductase subunit B